MADGRVVVLRGSVVGEVGIEAEELACITCAAIHRIGQCFKIIGVVDDVGALLCAVARPACLRQGVGGGEEY